MLGYTRRQLVLLFIAVAVGAGGLAIDRWRRANPDVATYLETLDRSAPPAPAREPVARRPAARIPETPSTSVASAHGPAARRDPPRARRAPVDDATLVDVNLASAADFERLPGIGPALAARIVEVRAREGPFGSVEDLRRVRGVRDTTLARLRPRLAVNTP